MDRPTLNFTEKSETLWKVRGAGRQGPFYALKSALEPGGARLSSANAITGDLLGERVFGPRQVKGGIRSGGRGQETARAMLAVGGEEGQRRGLHGVRV